jgi:hypothetical protein
VLLLAVGGLGFLAGRETAPQTAPERADTAVPDEPAPSVPAGEDPAGDPRDVVYAADVQELQAVLAAYAVQAQEVLDHEQVAGLSTVLVRHETALADLAASGRDHGTARGAALAELADAVRREATALREEAASEETGHEGVERMQAFGREVGVRASRLGAVLARLPGGRVDEVLREAAAEVAAPLAADPGGDDPAAATRR